jgi:hypothetical protein
VPPPTAVVPADTVVVEKPVVVFKDRPELVERVHIVTKPAPAVATTLTKLFPESPIDPMAKLPDTDKAWRDSEGKPMPLVRVTFDGEKLFTQEGGTVKYGWRGTGDCEVQLEDGGEWFVFGSSPLDLQDSHAVAVQALSVPLAALPRNRFTLGAGYGNSGWVGAFGVSRSLVWKNRFTKAVMPDELGAMAVMHASRDMDGLVTASWRF